MLGQLAPRDSAADRDAAAIDGWLEPASLKHGMTAGQLRYYINQLAASGRDQSLTGNCGVGAKVAAGSRNPHGLEYRSRHQGEGSLVPGGSAMSYGEHPAAVQAATARNRSQVLDSPDPVRAVEQVHWTIQNAFVSYQDAAERRRQLAAETGEMTTLVGAGWSQRDARDADIRSLIWPEADR